ncbi:MAG: hypothetical protein GY754_22760 [bacterium]|nr:hypothetical protein [bacterium]
MVQMIMQVPDELAEKCRSIGQWMPAILELSLIGFKTLATAAATEVILFLSGNPSPDEVLNFYVSDAGQSRLRRLLALNEAGLLSETEHLELDELQRLEHLIIMLKSRITSQLQQEH